MCADTLSKSCEKFVHVGVINKNFNKFSTWLDKFNLSNFIVNFTQ